MHTNEAVALVRSLAVRPARESTGQYFVEGIRGVLQALDAGLKPRVILYSEILLRNPVAQKRVRIAKREGIPVHRMSPEEFRRISRTERASGLAAILPQHTIPLERADPREGLCWLALSRLRSAGNLGTILRTAETVSAGGIVFLGDDIDPFDPAVIRASMGGIFRLKLARTTLRGFQAWSREHSCQVIGTSPEASASYTEIPVPPPLVIFLGEERAGMTEEEMKVCTETARIPIVGRADSLNVGVAAGVMLYEVFRRRSRGV